MILYIQIRESQAEAPLIKSFISCSVGAFLRLCIWEAIWITNKVKAAVVVAIISAVLVASGILQLQGAM
ncbi:hypothetical protein [Paenibacillus sp. RC67]|uniref:hypothetical protein n=1 Tax=Paenibacillus sp. RC67 TaxID=3039392 RepID=UPI0024AC8570|nr:hypothetical protein [Paenibacillus sp. RC67]